MSWTISIINVAPDGRKDVLESYRYKTLAEASIFMAFQQLSQWLGLEADCLLNSRK